MGIELVTGMELVGAANKAAKAARKEKRKAMRVALKAAGLKNPYKHRGPKGRPVKWLLYKLAAQNAIKNGRKVLTQGDYDAAVARVRRRLAEIKIDAKGGLVGYDLIGTSGSSVEIAGYDLIGAGMMSTEIAGYDLIGDDMMADEEISGDDFVGDDEIGYDFVGDAINKKYKGKPVKQIILCVAKKIARKQGQKVGVQHLEAAKQKILRRLTIIKFNAANAADPLMGY